MTLHFTSGTNTAANASAYQVTGGEWASGTIQWTNKPAADVLLESNISNNDRTKYQFSVLTAARHWYDGDPTGQNENYGIMLRYYDETLTGYYNSVYSGDVVDTNSRPKLTISYTPPNDEVSVLEGYIKQLTVPDTTETITWTSSDTAVATVDSAGKVTGVKAGKVTITASAGGAELQTYTVYVRIQNGIYRIDCKGIHSYLSANSGPLENATTVLRMVSEEGLPMLRQQWRVTYLSAGYYVIRPMHNQNMALHAKNGVSDVTTIGYNNTLSGVPAENRWTIEYLNGGYTFKCQGDDSQALRCSATHPGSSVFTGAYSSTIYWVFESVSSVPTQFIILDRGTGEISTDATRFVAAGETVTLSDLEIAAVFVTSDTVPDISWESYAPSKASVNSQTGAVTGIVEGEAVTITAKCTFRGVAYTKSYTVYVAEEDVPVMRIRHCYDLGYEVREGDASAAIQSYQNTVSARFEEIFGITLFYSIYEYTSICDECVLDQSHVITSDTLEILCRHYPYCATTTNLRDDLFSGVSAGDDTTTVVIWSGRRMSAYEDDHTNSLETNHSVVMTTYGIADWLQMDDAYGEPIDTEGIFKERTNTLFHELSHQLGAPDHYCYKDWDENEKCSNSYCDICVYHFDVDRICIMGRDTKITDSVVYCEDCFNKVSDHIDEHHYPLSN